MSDEWLFINCHCAYYSSLAVLVLFLSGRASSLSFICSLLVIVRSYFVPRHLPQIGVAGQPHLPIAMSADFADQELLVLHEDILKIQDLSFRWQVCYEQRGVPYWWDYNVSISLGLENAYQKEELFGFDWDWQDRKNGEISEYIADPERGFAKNEKTKYQRKIRRIVLVR